MSKVVSIDDNMVVTAGLGNCIAIAAYNLPERRMAIAHFDTVNCFDHEARNPDEPFKFETLVFWREWLVLGTRANAFAIGLGRVWPNTAPEGTKKDEAYPDSDNWRFDLIKKVKSVFNHEPIVCGSCIRFSLEADIEGSMSEDWMRDGRWADDGTEIPYAAIP